MTDVNHELTFFFVSNYSSAPVTGLEQMHMQPTQKHTREWSKEDKPVESFTNDLKNKSTK